MFGEAHASACIDSKGVAYLDWRDAIMFLPYRIKPPTPGQFAAFFWTLFIILIGFGVVCLYMGYRAPPERMQDAAETIRYGYGSIAVAVAIYIIRRWFCGYSS
jgi:hypothetical protein